MPTYEYACRDCGEHLEVVQSFKDDALTICPACSGDLRKVFSAAGIIFKGSGWHVKDYASSGRSGASSDPSESTSDKKPVSSDAGSTASDSTATGTATATDTSKNTSSGKTTAKSGATSSSGSTAAPQKKSA